MSDRPSDRIDSVIRASLELIEGRWKVPILYALAVKGELRFNELMRELDGISARMLTKQLKELEDDKMVIRMVFPENPPKVLYSLSYRGASVIPILQSIAEWGLENVFDDQRIDTEIKGYGMQGYPRNGSH